MNNNEIIIDLSKLVKYIVKWIWIPIALAVLGFGYRYWHTTFRLPNTYTASGTMYVFNGNPNLVNYQYASTTDLDSAVKLIDTYMIVVRSKKVMDVVAERLSRDYPGIEPAFISGSLGMNSIADTGVVRVSSITGEPQLSADICNTVLDVAPAEIIRVVGAGSVEVIDYASVPEHADNRRPMRRGVIGAMAGTILGLGVIFLLFLFNRRITDEKDLTENYEPPVLSSIRRIKGDDSDAGDFVLTKKSPMEQMESYARLRMNLLYTLVDKPSNVVVVTSAVSGEGKSTIAANLAISCALSRKKVLLVDADLRRGCQRDIFNYEKAKNGLSEALLGDCRWQDAVIRNIHETLDLLPSGKFPPNPAELLGSEHMTRILGEMGKEYELVLLDMPPVNIVTDPLVLSSQVAGCLFVTRQNFSDHRDLKKALNAAELTGMNVMGFVFYGEKLEEGGYYRKRYYKKYYGKTDHRAETAERPAKSGQQSRQQPRSKKR